MALRAGVGVAWGVCLCVCVCVCVAVLLGERWTEDNDDLGT